MLTLDSDVRIIDFGIALVADSEISRIEGIAGSPSYMSPEQVQSIELTNRSDLYSLGAVMYELLTGTRPFRAGNLQKLSAPDRVRDPSAHSHAAAGDSGGTRERDRDGAAEGSGKALQDRPRFRRGADARPSETARPVQPHRPAGAIQPAAQAQVLPRVLPQRDLGGAAREQLAGLRRRRGDRQGRGDGRSLLHHRAGTRAASRGWASRWAISTPAIASARPATCAAPSAPRPSSRRARSSS